MTVRESRCRKQQYVLLCSVADCLKTVVAACPAPPPLSPHLDRSAKWVRNATTTLVPGVGCTSSKTYAWLAEMVSGAAAWHSAAWHCIADFRQGVLLMLLMGIQGVDEQGAQQPDGT
jgi:hypothetical protein